MSVREVVTLGTASQVPTRDRAHHATFLRFDTLGLLFDPGEGAQRQLLLAGIPVSAIDRVCLTHVHGDHCLGVPGIVQRCSLDGRTTRLDLHAPSPAVATVEALCAATPFEAITPVEIHGHEPGDVLTDHGFRLRTEELSHRLPTLGWRVDEPDGWQLIPELADDAGVHGPERRRLLEHGEVRIGARVVEREEIARLRPGQSVAFVMDTRWCEGALRLAAEVDLLVIEATFLDTERDLAEEAGHLTAGQAARLAQQAGARRVVLTHLSQRYPDPAGHLAEARASAPGLDVAVARDLDRFPLPPRRPL